MPSKPRMPHTARITSPRQRRSASSFAFKMDITIPARASAISPLVDTVMTAVRQQASAKELEIETALREALANGIKHGCLSDPTKFVQCSVVFEDDHSVFIVVSDPGPGFDA